MFDTLMDINVLSPEGLRLRMVASTLETLRLNSPDGKIPFKGDLTQKPLIESYLVRPGYDPAPVIRQEMQNHDQNFNPKTDLIIPDTNQSDLSTNHNRYLHLRYPPTKL